MALYNPATRTVIASAHVRAVYGLFKGVAGLEDTILFVNNVANSITFRAKSPDPATDVIFMSLQNASATNVWSQTYQGNQFTRNTNPYERFKDLGVSGLDLRFYHTGGAYKIQQNTGSEGTPTWTDRFVIDIATGTVTTGSFPIGDNTVTTAKIVDGAVTSAKILDGTITPADVGGGTYNINISGNATTATTAAPTGTAGGSLTGTYPNPTFAANTVGTAHIVDGTVTGPKLAVITPVTFAGAFTVSAGGIGVNGAATPVGINQQAIITASATEAFGILNQPTFAVSTTTNAYVGFFRAVTQASYVATNVFGVHVAQPVIGAGNSITNIYGVFVANQDVSGVIGSTGVYVAAGNDVGIDVIGGGIRVVGGVTIVSGSFSIGGDAFLTRSAAATFTLSDSLIANGSIKATTFLQVGSAPPSDGSIRMDYDTYIRWHNNAAGNGGAIGETGANTMFYTSTATGAGTFAHRFDTGTGGPSNVIIYGDGGLVVGSPSGASKGPGTINATQVWRNGTSLDKVFEPDYDVMSIANMRAYYKEHKHLPTLPTSEVHSGGSTDVGALGDRLWETVEVQAIYIAELEDRINKLEAAHK